MISCGRKAFCNLLNFFHAISTNQWLLFETRGGQKWKKKKVDKNNWLTRKLLILYAFITIQRGNQHDINCRFTRDFAKSLFLHPLFWRKLCVFNSYFFFIRCEKKSFQFMYDLTRVVLTSKNMIFWPKTSNCYIK